MAKKLPKKMMKGPGKTVKSKKVPAVEDLVEFFTTLSTPFQEHMSKFIERWNNQKQVIADNIQELRKLNPHVKPVPQLYKAVFDYFKGDLKKIESFLNSINQKIRIHSLVKGDIVPIFRASKGSVELWRVDAINEYGECDMTRLAGDSNRAVSKWNIYDSFARVETAFCYLEYALLYFKLDPMFKELRSTVWNVKRSIINPTENSLRDLQELPGKVRNYLSKHQADFERNPGDAMRQLEFVLYKNNDFVMLKHQQSDIQSEMKDLDILAKKIESATNYLETILDNIVRTQGVINYYSRGGAEPTDRAARAQIILLVDVLTKHTSIVKNISSALRKYTLEFKAVIAEYLSFANDFLAGLE